MNNIIMAITAVTVVMVILVICLHKKIKCEPILMALAILLAGGTCSLCAWALESGSSYLKPEGDPAETLDTFLVCIENGNYEEAYSYLENYSTLGLENMPEATDSAKLYDALRHSYSHSMSGEPVVDGLNAWQYVDITSLDMPAVKAALKDEVTNMLEDKVENTPASKVYDADKNYLPEFVYELYDEAMDSVLAHSGDYRTTSHIMVELRYDGENWFIKADNAMFIAFCGNGVG